MSAKTIISDLGQTGLTIYAVVQNSLGNYFDNSDGTFKSVPTTPNISLTEDSLILGRYANRNIGTAAIWPNGVYYSAIFNQIGGSADLSSDELVGSGEIYIDSDAEVSISNVNSTVNNILSTSNVMSVFVNFNLFKYFGNNQNIFSIISGSFTGSINFYSVDVNDFIVNSSTPPLTNLICTLNSNGTMSDVSGLTTSGDIIFFTLVGFEALSDIILNYYNFSVNSNTNFFIPNGLSTVTTSTPYYPTTFGILLTKIGSGTSAVPLSDGFINKNIANMNNIEWDRIASPIVVTSGNPNIF